MENDEFIMFLPLAKVCDILYNELMEQSDEIKGTGVEIQFKDVTFRLSCEKVEDENV